MELLKLLIVPVLLAGQVAAQCGGRTVENINSKELVRDYWTYECLKCESTDISWSTQTCESIGGNAGVELGLLSVALGYEKQQCSGWTYGCPMKKTKFVNIAVAKHWKEYKGTLTWSSFCNAGGSPVQSQGISDYHVTIPEVVRYYCSYTNKFVDGCTKQNS
ncbi:hypothetical protein GGI12_002200 [Dipsacomyces acuminosporus]|nr:hypothetical protein GGI12_002200 [Dipsacomyces acuminosporus]